MRAKGRMYLSFQRQKGKDLLTASNLFHCSQLSPFPISSLTRLSFLILPRAVSDMIRLVFASFLFELRISYNLHLHSFQYLVVCRNRQETRRLDKGKDMPRAEDDGVSFPVTFVSWILDFGSP